MGTVFFVFHVHDLNPIFSSMDPPWYMINVEELMCHNALGVDILNKFSDGVDWSSDSLVFIG